VHPSSFWLPALHSPEIHQILRLADVESEIQSLAEHLQDSMLVPVPGGGENDCKIKRKINTRDSPSDLHVAHAIGFLNFENKWGKVSASHREAMTSEAFSEFRREQVDVWSRESSFHPRGENFGFVAAEAINEELVSVEHVGTLLGLVR
jgi:hypothetical protein